MSKTTIFATESSRARRPAAGAVPVDRSVSWLTTPRLAVTSPRGSAVNPRPARGLAPAALPADQAGGQNHVPRRRLAVGDQRLQQLERGGAEFLDGLADGGQP